MELHLILNVTNAEIESIVCNYTIWVRHSDTSQWFVFEIVRCYTYQDKHYPEVPNTSIT